MPGGFIELKEKDSAEAGFAHKPSDGMDEYATAKPRMTEAQRIQAFMDVAATHVEQTTGSKEGGTCLRASAPFISALVWIAVKVAPIYAWLFEKAHWVHEHAPVKVLEMIFGLALCFFGGTYVAAIAAVEAWRHMGWQRSYADAVHVWEQTQHIRQQSKKDDFVDADGNGIADVDEITPQQLVQRKMNLAMTVVKDPDRLIDAVGGLWAAYLAVLATLRLEFARVTALALGIAEMVKFPIVRVAGPPLSSLLGPERKHWVMTIITVVLNVLVISFAWFLQKIISAFNSALRGGKMFGEALLGFLDEKGLLAKVPFMKAKDDGTFDVNDTYLDEIIGYLVAAVGFYSQIYSGFSLPFPINLVLLPLTIVEYILEWEIVVGAGTHAPVAG